MPKKDAEIKHRKSRQDVVWGSIAFLFGLFGVIVLLLSIAGYIPSIPEDPQGPFPLTPFTWGISSILMVGLGLYLMARGYRLRKFEEVKTEEETSIKNILLCL